MLEAAFPLTWHPNLGSPASRSALFQVVENHNHNPSRLAQKQCEWLHIESDGGHRLFVTDTGIGVTQVILSSTF